MRNLSVIKSIIVNHSDLIVSAFVALIGVYIFYPGAMSGDSVAQFRQVLHPKEITTWYPPVMVYLWIILNKITSGPQGMLIFHYGIYSLSIYFLSNIFYRKILDKIIYILFLGFFPPLFFLNGVIWKDVSMLASLSMSFSILFKFSLKRKRIFLFFSILFLVYGISVRHNAIVCLVPYVIYLINISMNYNNGRKIIIFSVMIPISLFFGSKLTHSLNNAFVEEGNIAHQIENSTFIWDLWGMSVELDKNIIPEYIFNDAGKTLTIEKIKEFYAPYSCTVLWIPYLNPNRWTKEFPDKMFKKEFIRLILKYPSAYIKVRSRAISYMLGINKPVMVAYDFDIFKPLEKDHWLYETSKNLEIRHKDAASLAQKIAFFLEKNTPLYLVWVYLVLIFLQIILLFLYRTSMKLIMNEYLLIMSVGLIYWIPYIIISPSADFRFSNLTIYCSIVMMPLLLQQVFNSIVLLVHKKRQPKSITSIKNSAY